MVLKILMPETCAAKQVGGFWEARHPSCILLPSFCKYRLGSPSMLVVEPVIPSPASEQKNAHIAASWDASLSFLIIVSSVNSEIHPPSSRSMAAEVFGPFFLENIFADESWADSIDPNTKFSCLARKGLG